MHLRWNGHGLEANTVAESWIVVEQRVIRGIIHLLCVSFEALIVEGTDGLLGTP